MENRNNPVISKGNRLFVIVAVAVMFLMTFLVINPINEANALFVLQKSTGKTNSGYTMPLTTNIASFGNKQWNLFETITNQTLLTFNATNGALLQNISLTVQINGNHKTPSGLDCTTTGAGGNGWCLATYSGGTGADRLFIIDITNTAVCSIGVSGASYNNGFLFNRGVMSGFDSLGATTHVFYWDSSGTNKIFYDSWSIPYNFAIINGNQVPTTPQVCGIWDAPSQSPVAHVDTGLVGANPYDSFYATVRNVTSGTSNNEIGWSINGINTFQIFNVGAQTSRCSVNTGANVFQVTYKQNPTTGAQNWYVTSSVGNWVKIYDNNCNLITTLTASTYDSASVNVRSVAIGTIRNEIYMYTNTGAGTGAILVVNATTPYKFVTKIGVVGDAGAGTNRFAELLAEPDNNVIVFTDLGVSNSGTNAYNVIYWNINGAPSGGGGTTTTSNTCFDTTPNGSTATLICFPCPAPQGATYSCPHGFPAGTGLGRFSQGNLMNGTTSLANIGCVTGWFSCTNLNVTTNGTGFWLLIIVILFTALILLYATYKTGHQVHEVTFPIILLAVLECGAFWQANITTSLPFFVGILGLIGIAGFKIYEKVTGGGE